MRPVFRRSALVVTRVVVLFTTLLTTLWATERRAEAEPRFGDANGLVFAADLAFGAAERTGGSLEPDRGVRLDLSIDAFVVRSLSLGGDVRVAAVKTLADGAGSELSTWPRVGWAAPLGPWLVFWPRIGPRLGTSAAGPRRQNAVAAELYAPLHLLPIRHLAIGVGPRLSVDLVRRFEGMDLPRGIELSLATEIAGWF